MAKANYHIRRKCPICGIIFEIRTIDAVYLEKPNKFDPFGQKELTLLATI